jgi:parallel beta-helix repeat protein
MMLNSLFAVSQDRGALATAPVIQVAAALRRLAVIAVAIVVVTLAWDSAAAAKDYYVDGQAGSDSNQGTQSEPYRSFAHAVAMLAPGDKLIVASGRYTESLIVAKSGTAEKPISIVGEGRPLIESDDNPIVISGSYVDISGFEGHARGEGSAISVGRRNHHVRIADNIARDSGCGGIMLLQTDYVTIENNRVFGNSRRSPWQCSGISIYQAINFDHVAGIHNIIRRNIVYDNMDVVVDNKITNSNGKTTDGNGIIFDDARHSQGSLKDPPYDGLTLIENNIVFDNGGRGIHVFESDHVIVRNNTSYHNVKDPNLEGRERQAEFTAVFASDVRFVNNIAVPRDNGVFGFLEAQTGSNIVWDFNLIEGGAIPEVIDPHSGWGRHNKFAPVGVDFVAPSVDPKTADFRLRRDSPAIGAGDVDDAPNDDFSGASRPRLGPIDLGALQTSAAVSQRQ